MRQSGSLVTEGPAAAPLLVNAPVFGVVQGASLPCLEIHDKGITFSEAHNGARTKEKTGTITMNPTVEYFYTPLSPFTYLGHPRLTTVIERTGALLRHRPIRLAEVFAASGGLPLPQRPAARRAYRLVELERIAAHHDLPITLTPRHFPTDDTLAAGMIVAAQDEGAGGEASVQTLAFTLMRALWAEEKDIADPEVCADCAAAAGFDAAALIEAARAPAVEATRTDNTREAIARGVFGVPTYMVGDELFWGQDRLDYLERAIARA